MRIFCIGFQKTGLTSLRFACSELGISCILWKDLNWNCEREISQELLDQIKSYDDALFLDGPIWFPNNFKILHEQFRDSKFILTVRDSDEWFNSMQRFFTKFPNNVIHPKKVSCRKQIYGYSEIETKNKDEFVKVFENYKIEVINYFEKYDKNNLLILDVSNNSWNQLCNFLEKKIPDKKFPHVNKS